MAAKQRKVWILAKRYDLTENGVEAPCRLTDISFLEHEEGGATPLQSQIRQTFGLDEKLVLKLRNHRGSLVPINTALLSNSKTVPYILEVVKVHQNITPSPQTVKIPNYHETLRSTMNNFLARMETLETTLPELKERRSDKIESEMDELSRKVNFINKRFNEADSTQWNGMFKKHPLW